MNHPPAMSTARWWPVLVLATALLAITMGIRQSLGLFVQPIALDTGLGIAQISFALAVAQLVWGLVQPVFGAIADQRGPLGVLVAGGLLLALGMALAPVLASDWGLLLSLGLLSAAGAGAASFSVLIGATAWRIPENRRSMASGVINAGGSFGQFLFAPLVQVVISLAGWMMAMWTLALAALATLPLAWPLRRRQGDASGTPAVSRTADAGTRASAITDSGKARGRPSTGTPAPTLREQLGVALRDRSYWCLHIGFFTCGFHIAFLVTHLPGEVDLCGLPPTVASWSLAIIGLANIFGSLYAGSAISRYRSRNVLAAMYGSRAVLVALYLMAPKTEWTFYLFAAGLGFTWLATVPPTAALVGKLFGVRYLATLFGLTLLSHQVGGFLGAWLGGISITMTGDYSWMWYADIALAAAAALLNLPIREAPVVHAAAPA